LYPFHLQYPLKIWSKYRWWKNRNLKSKLKNLNRYKKTISVIDRLGAPGDTLITANLIRCIKKVYTKIKVNCITPNPKIIEFDPSIDSINKPENFYSFDSSYLELVSEEEKDINIVKFNLNKLGINYYHYKSRFYLTSLEKEWANKIINSLNLKKPPIAICTRSKEPVKNWPTNYWAKLIPKLQLNNSIIQIGDESEPNFNNTIKFAGKFTIRESAAILSKCQYFIGPDSLLMHIANGLDIPSIIIFGGARPVNSFAYTENENLHSKPDCSPCWIHKSDRECENDLKCMSYISHEQVFTSFIKLQKQFK